MKRILKYQRILDVQPNTNLSELKVIYRNMMKKWHPDKFTEGDELFEEAQLKSKSIIEAYHFLVSISEETRALNLDEYNITINDSFIEDFTYKGQTLNIVFQDGNIYEYFGVPKSIYLKLVNTATQGRFARRHIFNSYIYRKVFKNAVAV